MSVTRQGIQRLEEQTEQQPHERNPEPQPWEVRIDVQRRERLHRLGIRAELFEQSRAVDGDVDQPDDVRAHTNER